jgi:hypothetical protein
MISITDFFQRTIVWIAALLSLLAMTTAVSASESLKVTYGLYASGFNVVEIEGTYAIRDDRYDLTMDLKTAGLLGKLAPWSGVLKTNGMYSAENSTPLEHSFASTWRDDTETRTLTFDEVGQFISHTKQENGEIDDRMPDKELYEGGVIDTLTAMFRSMNQDTCEGTHDVMDGKRRFDMVFKSKGTKNIEQSRYTVFEGKAEKCEVEIVPTSGKWRDKKRGWMSIQEQAKDNGQLPKIWFAKLRDDFPPVPVRFLITTNYGTMIMHVKDIQ